MIREDIKNAKHHKKGGIYSVAALEKMESIRRISRSIKFIDFKDFEYEGTAYSMDSDNNPYLLTTSRKRLQIADKDLIVELKDFYKTVKGNSK